MVSQPQKRSSRRLEWYISSLLLALMMINDDADTYDVGCITNGFLETLEPIFSWIVAGNLRLFQRHSNPSNFLLPPKYITAIFNHVTDRVTAGATSVVFLGVLTMQLCSYRSCTVTLRVENCGSTKRQTMSLAATSANIASHHRPLLLILLFL